MKKIFLLNFIALSLFIIYIVTIPHLLNNDNSYNVDVINNNYYKHYYDKYISINEDYIGQIVFDSGLLDKPIVQAKSCYRKDGSPYHFYNEDGSVVEDFDNYNGNDVYLWMNYETMEYDYFETGGSIFMDYRNTLDDQNLIVYGHFFPNHNSDPNRIKGFTPLEKLLTKDGYEDNKYVSLCFQNQKYDYELAAVFYYDNRVEYYQDFCQYYRPNFNYDDFKDIYDPNYCSYYFNLINSIKLYDTNVSLSSGDRTLTLQTCTDVKDVYEVCVFKLINISEF